MPERAASPGGGDDPPSRAEALRRLDVFRPADYARTRNHLEGAVSRLSPYVTHGILSLPEIYQSLDRRDRIGPQHKFTYELGWREYFHFRWQSLGDGIFESQRAGPLPDGAYSQDLPNDIRTGTTGVPVVDRAVAELYRSGWLHNHARMWLASYLIHVRKIHWRVGADWMVGHLLDGDLASNHLSWQWVAGTDSHKPYLFNAENVARYAPPDWHSPGSVIDARYEDLDAMARDPSQRDAGGSRARTGVRGPEGRSDPLLGDPSGVPEPALMSRPERTLPEVKGADLTDQWLVHPWAIRPAPAGQSAVGILVSAFHRTWPWSARRWSFVLSAMDEVCDRIVWCVDEPPTGLDWTTGGMVADPHLSAYLRGVPSVPPPRLFTWPDRECRSFSAFWSRSSVASR
jgi:deoxyribodipyrimidine photo-lyase